MPLHNQDFYGALGRRIMRARSGAGLTQAALAQRVGLSRASITNIEVGRQAIQVHILVKISEELKVPVAQLLLDRQEDTSVGVEPKLVGMEPERRTWVEKFMRDDAHES